MKWFKKEAVFIISLILVPIWGCGRNPASIPGTSALTTEELWKIDHTLEFAPQSDDNTFSFQYQADESISVFGAVGEQNRLLLRAAPIPWDLSNYSALTLQMKNGGERVARISASLLGVPKRPNRLGGVGSLILLPGESGVLTIPFGFAAGEYNSLPSFESVAIKPNGHRQHWNPVPRNGFNRIELDVSSPSDRYVLESIRIGPSYPLRGEHTSALETLPYLDPFGQCRVLNWPGKLTDLSALRSRDKATPLINGSLTSPEVENEDTESPSWFQAKKIDGRWWFVDGDGEPYWSLGIARVGFGTPVRLWKRRQLFQWIPANAEGPFGTAFSKRNGIGFFDFYRANAIRELGRHHRRIAAARTVDRLKTWGITTIGVHSDPVIINSSDLPFAVIVNPSERVKAITTNLPDPFSPDFQVELDEQLKSIAEKLENRPRCIGVFVDEDQRWPTDLVSRVLDKDTPARHAMLNWLLERYETIDALNKHWETEFASWESVRVSPEMIGRYRADQFADEPSEGETVDHCVNDIRSLESLFAGRYFSLCARTLNKYLPNHLYLGSRISYCSPAVAAVCAEHADVVSLNCSDYLPSCFPLPSEIDKPVLISRFQIGSLDRGVPAMGAVVTFNQTQRARAFAASVVTALSDPRIVGLHWDTYADAPLAAQPGRADRPGWVDITDLPYQDLTKMSSRVSRLASSIRTQPNENMLETIEKLLIQIE